MEGAKLNRAELTNLIVYGLVENGIDTNNINTTEINHIINDYLYHCDFFQRNYVRGELDTFKRAACLLVAINNSRIVRDEYVRARVALDAAHKWIETPVWHYGPNFDEPTPLETVNFKEVFKGEEDVINTSKEMLIASLVHEKGLPINYNLNLELIYYVAIEKKKIKALNREEVKEVESVPEVILPEKEGIIRKALKFVGLR